MKSKLLRAGNQTMPRDKSGVYMCQFAYGSCVNEAVRCIRWDTNNYENDKYGWACEEHLKLEV